MKNINLLGLITIIISVPLLSSLIFPETADSASFWLKTSWITLLFCVNWLLLIYFFFKSGEGAKSSQFGSLPAINMTIFFYSLLSAGLIFLDILAPSMFPFPNSHMIFQVIAGALCIMAVLFIMLAGKAGETPKIAEGITPKEDLLKSLQNVQTVNDHKGIKEICEIIQYSIPHLSRLKSIEDYKHFCQLVCELELRIDSRLSDQFISELKIAAKKCH